jgi:hypothetical protein
VGCSHIGIIEYFGGLGGGQEMKRQLPAAGSVSSSIGQASRSFN